MAGIPKAKIEEWRAISSRTPDGDALFGAWGMVHDVAMTAMAKEAVPALLSEREDLLSLLREVEWKGADIRDDGYMTEVVGGSACPICGNGLRGDTVPAAGHAPDCRLAQALRE